MKVVVIVLSLLLFACNDTLEIKQDYSFTVKTLPLPKKIRNGESVALEFTIVREQVYKSNRYSFRYFQADGKGTLMNDRGDHYAVNRFYALDSDTFKMLYRSDCDETQALDFVFCDSFGNEAEYSVSFQNDNKE